MVCYWCGVYTDLKVLILASSDLESTEDVDLLGVSKGFPDDFWTSARGSTHW